MGLSPWLYGIAVYSMPARYTNGGCGNARTTRVGEDGAGTRPVGSGQIFRRFISRSASRSNSSADSGGT